MCWSTRVPSLVTSHLRVSQTRVTPSAWSAPLARIVRVTSSRSVAFSSSATPHGSSSQGLAQEPTWGGTGASSSGAPATRPEARAMRAARSPAARAAAGLASGMAWKPHEPPISARTPTPVRSSRFTPSTAPLRAVTTSDRDSIARASAYRAPALRAASTAAVARSYIAPS